MILIIIPVAECRTVAIGIVPLCRVVTPVYKHRDNDCTQWCDLDSDSPALSHQFQLSDLTSRILITVLL